MLAIAGLTAGPYCNHGTRYPGSPGYPVPCTLGVTLAKKSIFLIPRQRKMRFSYYTNKTYFTGFH